MNLRFRKIALTEALNTLLQPHFLFSQPYQYELLKENSIIHVKLGFEKEETYYYKYGKWEISFTPDKVMDNMIIECKILRPYSKKDELTSYAKLQALIEAYFLNIPKYKIVLYDYKEQKVIIEQEYDTDRDLAETILNSMIKKLEALRDIFVSKDTSELA